MNENNFILQEVIDELVNPDKSLSGPLMKLNYFGRLIKNEELINYTSKEIKGYNPDDDIPQYRKTRPRLQTHIKNRFFDQSVEVPVSMLEEPFNKGLEFLCIYDGIAVIENMENQFRNSNGTKKEFYRPIPLEMLHPIQDVVDKLFPQYGKLYVQSAQTIGNANVFLEANSAVREKLLELVMDIGEKFGFNIEINSFKANNEENNKTINNIMNNIFNSGDGNVINTGDNNQITNSSTITKGDLENLQKKFKELGIEDSDIAEITEIIQNENPNEDQLGEKSKGWIMKIMKKSMDGIGKIAIGASGNLLATIIKGFYGIV